MAAATEPAAVSPDGSAQGPIQPAPAPGTACALGWAMADLYRPLGPAEPAGGPDHLPAVAELDTDERTRLAFAKLRYLAGPFGELSVAAPERADLAPASDKAALRSLHDRLLERLIDDPGQLSAYQLGLALSDTCALGGDGTSAKDVLGAFDRQRLATLQGWLGQAGGALPPQAGAVVGRSLQNWQDWADVNATALRRPGAWEANQANVAAALRNQGHAWRALLTAEQGANGQPSIDAWVHAGESVLRTARALVRKALLRFWPVVVVVVAVVGALLYLIVANASGISRVWASLVTVAGGLGLGGASVRAAALRAGRGIEQNVWYAAAADARAWQATWLPTLQQSLYRRYRLERRGVGFPQVKKGLEQAGG